MKNSLVIIGIIAVLVSSAFMPPRRNSAENSAQMGQRVVAALRQSAPDQYIALFPTLQDFHRQMEAQATIYGVTLEAAKADFSSRYTLDVLTSVTESYDAVRRQGVALGIDWNKIEFVRAETENATNGIFKTAPMTIIFASGEKQYRLVLENAFVVDGQWKVGRLIKLI